VVTLGEQVAPIARRAAIRAMCEPETSADVLFLVSDAVAELAEHIALTADGPFCDEPLRLVRTAAIVRAVATARVERVRR
jgi:hypothetical protein